MKNIGTTTLLVLFLYIQMPGQLKIEIDYSNALYTFQILNNEAVLNADSLMQLQGSKNLIRQSMKFDIDANDEKLINELQLAISNDHSNTNKSFLFGHVKKELPSISALYNYISSNEYELNEYLTKELSNFLSPTDNLNITVFLILGGKSDGFAEGNSFNIDIGFFKDDLEALKLIMLHEVFHIVQNKLELTLEVHNLTGAKEDLYNLAKHVFQEGSASYIANPLTFKNPKTYNSWFQKKYQKNLGRIEDNFELLGSIIYRLLYDGDFKFEDAYNIGFSDQWGSPFYFVGFRMCELIRKYENEEFLTEYLRSHPTKFFLKYNSYAKKEKHQNEYPIFNETIEQYIREIDHQLRTKH